MNNVQCDKKWRRIWYSHDGLWYSILLILHKVATSLYATEQPAGWAACTIKQNQTKLITITEC